MLEKSLNFWTKFHPIYPAGDQDPVLRYTALILTSLIPFMLLFSRVVADTALTITGVLFTIHCIRTQDYNYLKKPIVITLILLWLWFMIGAFFAFSNNIDVFLTSLSYIRFILFFLACVCWLLTEIKPLKFVGTIISFTLILAASDALFQFIQGYSITGQASWEGRLTSFLRRPDIGIYLAKLIFPLVALWIRFDRGVDYKKTLWCSGLFLFSIMTIIFLTGERTATTLSFCALIFTLLVIPMTHKEFRGYMIGSMISVTGGFGLILFMVPFIYQRLLDLINDIVDFPHSLYGQLFKASILSWYKYGFFTGVGIHQFRNSCLLLKKEGFVTYCNLHSHNIYFEILSESGLVGLCLFIAFVLLCLWQVLHSVLSSRNDLRNFVSSILVFSGFFVILFPFSVTMSFISNWSAILNWVGISLCLSALALKSHKQ